MPMHIDDPFGRSEDELKRSEEQYRELDMEAAAEQADQRQRQKLIAELRRREAAELQRKVEGSRQIRGRK
jgi:hypothetical protein